MLPWKLTPRLYVSMVAVETLLRSVKEWVFHKKCMLFVTNDKPNNIQIKNYIRDQPCPLLLSHDVIPGTAAQRALVNSNMFILSKFIMLAA